MHVALIGADGVIINVITADDVERAQQFYPDVLCVERGDDVTAGPGDSYASGVWTPAAPVVLPVPPITKLDFLSRFTQAQRITISAQRTTDAVVGDAMYMLDLADNVDVTHADTIAFVEYIASKGWISTDDAQRILS